MKKELCLIAKLLAITLSIIIILFCVLAFIRGGDIYEIFTKFIEKFIFFELPLIDYFYLFLPYLILIFIIRPTNWLLKKYTKKQIFKVFAICIPIMVVFTLLFDVHIYTKKQYGAFYLDKYLSDLSYKIVAKNFPDYSTSLTATDCKHGYCNKKYEDKIFSNNSNVVEISGEGVYNEKRDFTFFLNNYTSHKILFSLSNLENKQIYNTKIESSFLRFDTVKHNPEHDTAKYEFYGIVKRVTVSNQNLPFGRYRLNGAIKGHKDLVLEFEYVKERSIRWQVTPSTFSDPDSIIFSIQNEIWDPVFYPSYGSELPIIAALVMGYKEQKVIYEQITGGMSCGTGIVFHPIRSNRTVKNRMENPIKSAFTQFEILQNKNRLAMENGILDRPLPVNSVAFKERFCALYGDSIGVRFIFNGAFLRWSSYHSQNIRSPEIKLHTKTLLRKWEKNIAENTSVDNKL